MEFRGTGVMWSEILNRPKQGKSFSDFREMLMNVPEDYDDEVERRATHPSLLP